MNRADVQHAISSPSSNAIVTEVQDELTQLSTEIDALKLPQVGVTDIPVLFDTLAPSSADPEALQNMSQLIQEQVAGATNQSKTIDWHQTELVDSDGVLVKYMSVSYFFDPSVSKDYLDLVVLTLSQEMHMDKLTITTETVKDATGKSTTNTSFNRSPLSRDELAQFQTLWQYSAADAIVKLLTGMPKAHVSTQMKVFPFRLANHRQNHALGLEVGGAFDGFRKIIDAGKGLWDGIVKGFGHSSSETRSVISQGGFSKFNEATDSYLLPGVNMADTKQLIDLVMSEYSDESKKETQDHMLALMLTHPDDDDAVWRRTHVIYGQNKTSGAKCEDGSVGCAEFISVHYNPKTEAAQNHWTVCTYHTEFVLSPTLVLVQDSDSSMFGLFSHHESHIERYDPVFTTEDETKLREFMSIQCQYELGTALEMPGLHPPAFPDILALV